MNDESGFDEAISADLTDGMNKNRKGHARPALKRRLSIALLNCTATGRTPLPT